MSFHVLTRVWADSTRDDRVRSVAEQYDNECGAEPAGVEDKRNSIRHHACDGARERYTVGAWLGRRLVVHFTTGRIRPLNFHTTGDATGDFRYIQYG
jgi:hypothetical protein